MGPIAEPPPRSGLPAHLTWWNLLSAGVALGIGLGIGLAVLPRKNGITQLAANPSHFKILAILGAASLAVYGLNFLLPFPLHRYYSLELGSFGEIADRDAGVALGLATAIFALFSLYYVAYRLCQGQDGLRLWIVVLAGALLFALVNSSVFAITSTDLYDYIARGRITTVHGGNPYVQTPGDYPTDPFMAHAAWPEATSAYGPLCELLNGLISRCAGDRLWDNLLAHKGLALVSYVSSTALIAVILRRTAPERALSGTLLFAWNPLILLEGLANGHNDLLMVALLLAAFWALAMARRTPAENPPGDDRGQSLLYGGLALTLLGMAVLVKFIPILFLPLFLSYLLAGKGNWRRQLGLGLLLLIPAVLVFAQYYRVFWHWPEVVNVFTRRGHMFGMSIVSVARAALKQHVDAGTARATAIWPAQAIFALGYLIVLVRAGCGLYRTDIPKEEPPPASRRGRLRTAARLLFGKEDHCERRPWNVLLGACFSILLLYLLLVSFWFWPWYLIWPIALLALAGDDRMTIPLALAGCAGELSHLGWNFVWYWIEMSQIALYQLETLIVFLLVVPALTAYIVLSWKHRSRGL